MPFHNLWAMLWWALNPQDPGLLEGRTEALNVALRLCRVAAEFAGRRGHHAHLWSTALQGNATAIDWGTCFFA